MTRKSQRGATLLEVMVATALITISMGGFVAMVVHASRATKTAHVRTAVSLLRTATLERISTVPRDGLTAFPSAFRIDRCYDGSSQETSQNASWSDSFACPTGTVYRTWLRVAAQASPARTWLVRAYAEKLEPGCTATTAGASEACSVGQLLLTD
jgi:Tfp pilus assembly protein PilV